MSDRIGQPTNLTIKRSHYLSTNQRTPQVLIPHFTGNMIDNVIGSGDAAAFKRSTLYLVLASTASGVLSGLR